jgi:predicted nucleic acid-binding protein
MAEPLVIDSRIAVKWLTDEPDSASAISILEKYAEREIELVAPDLIFSEIGNVIWRKVTFEHFAVTDAEAAIDNLNEIVIRTISSFSLFESAFAIAINHKRTFYDSLYLAASKYLSCRFVTAPERLYNSTRTSFPNIVLLSKWPE